MRIYYPRRLLLLAISIIGCWAALLAAARADGLFLALAMIWAGICVIPARMSSNPTARDLILPSVLLAIYATLFFTAPEWLARMAGMLCVALSLWLMAAPESRRGLLAVIPLLLCVSGAFDVIELYWGYPLRIIAGRLASGMLGHTVYPAGSSLTDGVHTVSIDTPCSGIRLLRAAIMSAAALALARRLGLLSVLPCLAAAGALAVAGNALRAASLFLLEARLAPMLPAWTLGYAHGAIGVLIAGACLVALALLVRRLPATPPAPYPDPAESTGAAFPHAAFAVLFLAAFAAAVAPFAVGVGVAQYSPPIAGIRWPAVWEGRTLISCGGEESPGLSHEDAGVNAVFRLDETVETVTLRLADPRTSRLHSPEVCYEAAGHHVSPLPSYVDARGQVWGRFRAVAPDGRVRIVRQRYFAVPSPSLPESLEASINDAPGWPDNGSCYWHIAEPAHANNWAFGVTIAAREGET